MPADTSSTNPNRARDHLANERTYLAWIRTAITLFSFGVLIVRLRYLLPAPAQGHSHGWQLGLLFAVVGLLMAALAHFHYFEVSRSIESNSFRPGARWVVLSTCAVLILGVGVLLFLISSVSTPSAAPSSRF